MRRYEREVTDPALIKAMLDLFDEVTVGINDTDGFPYLVPLNFGYEMSDTELDVVTHCAKEGKKVDLMKRDNRVCLSFSLFNDFPEFRYKGHHHDYRSVTAKGRIELIAYEDNPELWEKFYNLMYTCNHREIKPLAERKVIPPLYMGIIRCDLKDVTAKSEFPLRKVEDVPFMDVKNLPMDTTPFDIRDLIEAHRPKK